MSLTIKKEKGMIEPGHFMAIKEGELRGYLVTGKIAKEQTVHVINLDKRKIYDVVIAADGSCKCNCLGYFHHSKCRHSSYLASLVNASEIGASEGLGEVVEMTVPGKGKKKKAN